MAGETVPSEAAPEGRLAAKARLPLPEAKSIDFSTDRLSIPRCYTGWCGTHNYL
jgi:hypothetical protein